MPFIFIIILLFNFSFVTPSFKQSQKLTPITGKELFLILEEGHLSYFHTKPSHIRISVAWAHVGLESGQGSRIYNFNLGNIANNSKTEPYFFIGPYHFKANDSIQDGAVLYWKTIDKMCSSVLQYFDAGDPKGAAYQLFRCGYYRFNKEEYARIMNQLYWKTKSFN